MVARAHRIQPLKGLLTTVWDWMVFSWVAGGLAVLLIFFLHRLTQSGEKLVFPGSRHGGVACKTLWRLDECEIWFLSSIKYSFPYLF